ncbi:MAG TPA: helix-turn-helix transcriptional regulator [Candidatus Hydrogenedentes bacterium]|nr:helix-turn-helix transcriptional regulator [Candidatus Hydrogenedentota bacterium]HNT87699.1 helix-turn-helix transcriptional regulator [Candidatus Hydrogenedentota bacterium]
MTKQREQSRAIERSSGNTFADLGVRNPEEALAKAALARQIARIIDGKGWTQERAAVALGVDQAKVSALMRGRLQGFSTDRLLRFLLALGRNVDIVIRHRAVRAPRPRIHVSCR